ncbi:MAG: N-acetylmuramoyl-L-alanine amidase [Roseburia sp.]
MAKQNSVIIDPGHGGSDPGAVYGNRREKDDTLALSYDIGNALEQRGGPGGVHEGRRCIQQSI